MSGADIVNLAIFGLAILACSRWWRWKARYEDLRRHHVRAMKSAQVPFLHPPRLDPDTQARLVEIRQQIDRLNGLHSENVIEVDFRGGNNA